MEGVLDLMLFFAGLRALLHKKDEDMGKRGKRKRKYKNIDHNKEAEALDVMSKEQRKKDKKQKREEDNRKPFEKIALLPPRDAQEGHY